MSLVFLFSIYFQVHVGVIENEPLFVLWSALPWSTSYYELWLHGKSLRMFKHLIKKVREESNNASILPENAAEEVNGISHREQNDSSDPENSTPVVRNHGESVSQTAQVTVQVMLSWSVRSNSNASIPTNNKSRHSSISLNVGASASMWGSSLHSFSLFIRKPKRILSNSSLNCSRRTLMVGPSTLIDLITRRWRILEPITVHNYLDILKSWVHLLLISWETRPLFFFFVY